VLKYPKVKKGGTAPKYVVAHSFAEESVTESSSGERDAMVAIDGIGDVMAYIRMSNRKSWADLRIESSSERPILKLFLDDGSSISASGGIGNGRCGPLLPVSSGVSSSSLFQLGTRPETVHLIVYFASPSKLDNDTSVHRGPSIRDPLEPSSWSIVQ
jgi:hypothetical protein